MQGNACLSSVMNLLSAGVECYSVRDDRYLSPSSCYVKTELCFRADEQTRSVTGFQVRPVNRSIKTHQNLYLLYPQSLWKMKRNSKNQQADANK